MRNLIQILIKYNLFLLFLFLEIVAFVILVNSNSYHRSAYLNTATSVSGTMFKRIQHIKDFFILSKSNERLAAENAHIKNMLVSSYKANKVSYQDIYDSVYEVHWQHIACKLAYNTTNKQNNILIIDKGSKHGIMPEMGIVSDKGVLGIIKNVGKNYSSVLSLLNTNVNISAKMKKSEHFGTLKWDGQSPQYGYLSDIPNHITIENGDTIVTSGYSTIFPEGIIIGYVEDISEKKDLNFFRIKVALAEDFTSLTHAYVVKNSYKNEIDSLINITEQ